MHTIHLARSHATVAYDSAGHDDSSVIVLLHAYPFDRRMWKSQLRTLGTGHHVYALDIFGFGGSGVPPEGWTVDSMADAVAEFLEEMKIKTPVILGGLSMGGYIALAFARRHPDRLRALLLCNTRAEADTPQVRSSREQSMELARDLGSKAIVDVMFPRVLGETSHSSRPEVGKEVRHMGEGQTAHGIIAALQAMRDRPDATPGLAKIVVPTLVIVGAEDLITPPETARLLASTIPNAHLAILPLAGHLSNLETPDAFDEAVTKFLQGI